MLRTGSGLDLSLEVGLRAGPRWLRMGLESEASWVGGRTGDSTGDSRG